MEKFAQMTRRAVAVGALGLPVLSHAALDTAGIVAAGTEATTVAGVIGGVLVTIWAAKLVYRKFFGG